MEHLWRYMCKQRAGYPSAKAVEKSVVLFTPSALVATLAGVLHGTLPGAAAQ